MIGGSGGSDGAMVLQVLHLALKSAMDALIPGQNTEVPARLFIP